MALRLLILASGMVSVVLAAIACSSADSESPSVEETSVRAPSSSTPRWDLTVTFETHSATARRTDEFAVGGAAFDGVKRVLPADWKVCVEGAQQGCASGTAECVIDGDVDGGGMVRFAIHCDDHSNDDSADAPCATIADVEFCAVVGTLTSDESQCDEDNYASWDDALFCTKPPDSHASNSNGGVGREFGGTRYSVSWSFDKR